MLMLVISRLFASAYAWNFSLITLTSLFAASEIINKYGNPPIGEFNDVSIHLKKLSGDSILSAKEILDLACILKMSKELSLFFNEVSENINYDFNILKPFFNNLYLNIDLEKEIFLKVIDENTIDDRASDTLYSIRRSKKTINKAISRIWY